MNACLDSTSDITREFCSRQVNETEFNADIMHAGSAIVSQVVECATD